MWNLIPVGVEAPEPMGRRSPPLYEGNAAGQPLGRNQHMEFERDDFGTIVTEGTTVTTHRRYRVEDTRGGPFVFSACSIGTITSLVGDPVYGSPFELLERHPELAVS